jgi:hypothetical protein
VRSYGSSRVPPCFKLSGTHVLDPDRGGEARAAPPKLLPLHFFLSSVVALRGKVGQRMSEEEDVAGGAGGREMG